MLEDYLAELVGMPVKDFDMAESGDEDDEDDDEGEGEGAEGARRFEFQEGTSSKFWEIALEGESFTVRYGRTGTDGVSQTKDFDSEEKCEKEYNKLIQEKLKKGYSEVAGAGGTAGGASSIDPTSTIYRLGLTWEQEEEDITWMQVFSSYMKQSNVKKTVGLVIGKWGNLCEEDNTEQVVQALVGAKDSLPNLKAIFLGDVLSEDCEISWIHQTDVSALFEAFPNLTYFGVRGSDGLSVGPIKHAKLEALVIECGGLPKSVIEEILKSDLPQLNHLELFLGTDDYGANTTVDDFKQLLDGNKFPKLKYLGLRDSEIADQLAAALIGAPIVERLDELDLSLGTLGDEGGQSLLDNAAILKLKRLDVHHHYMSDEMKERLLLLPIEVDAGDEQGDGKGDEEDRYVAVGE